MASEAAYGIWSLRVRDSWESKSADFRSSESRFEALELLEKMNLSVGFSCITVTFSKIMRHPDNKFVAQNSRIRVYIST